MTQISTAQMNQEITHTLRQQGWCVCDNYLPLELAQRLADEARQRYQAQQMQLAGIGRGKQFHHNAEVRQDYIYWLDNQTQAQQEYFKLMTALQVSINRELYLGLRELEAHFAMYQPGGFYQKHLDSFQGAASRMVSSVTYLNFNWPLHAGGELLIYSSHQEAHIAKIAPEAGKLIVFLSAEIPHAVQPAHQPRLSIAGWFRT